MGDHLVFTDPQHRSLGITILSSESQGRSVQCAGIQKAIAGQLSFPLQLNYIYLKNHPLQITLIRVSPRLPK